MDQKNVLGRLCRDKITLEEGICVGTIDWLFGCRYYLAKKRTKNNTQDKIAECELQIPEACLEIVDNVPVVEDKIPEEEIPKFFGEVCRDRITGYVGICIGRIWTYYSEKQYCLQGKYNKKKIKKPNPVWVDEGRIEIIESDERIPPEVVNTERKGGVSDIPLPEFY